MKLYSLNFRAVIAAFALLGFFTHAHAAQDLTLGELRAQLAKAEADTAVHLTQSQALASKGDRPAYCASLKAMLESHGRKINALDGINSIVKNHPNVTPEQKKIVAGELSTAQEGQAELSEFIQKSCTEQKTDEFDPSTAVQKLTDAEDSGKKHLKDGVALMQSGDKPKGCSHMRLALKDYETQLDLTRKIKAAIETVKNTKPEMVVKLQYSIGKLEGDIKTIKSFIDDSCVGQ